MESERQKNVGGKCELTSDLGLLGFLLIVTLS